MYTKIFTVITVLVFLFGLISLLLGLSVATGVVVEPETGRYLGNRTSGEAIDQGIYRIIAAMAMGMLIKINKSVERLNDSDEGKS